MGQFSVEIYALPGSLLSGNQHSWASDRSAVEGQPALRRPPGASSPVPVDYVMAALRWLDRAERGAGDRHISPGSETRQ